MLIGLLAVLLGSGPPPLQSAPDQCPTCPARTDSIRRQIEALHAPLARERITAARGLADVRWECHPEVVAALAGLLHDDPRLKVRVEAARSLGRMIPNVPVSHLALDEAARRDAGASVRKQAQKALAAKGLRCVADCPICGPLPRGAAITGPAVVLPELDRKPERPPSDVDAAKEAPVVPPALPNPQP